MQVIVNYLPQFYETEINNKHFVKGYTEWTAVKNAKAFFEEHNQPQTPLNENYYSLLNVDTIKWQSGLAAKYGIDGFAIYHYYFEKDRLELNKPVEILLHNTDIDIRFFFVWANESWGRKVVAGEKSNQWTNIYDNEDGNDIFVEQKYEGIEQYRNHYEYIIKFINDKRYITIDGRPVFAIYNTSNIDSISEMMSLWTEWSKEDGNRGFYFIGINCWDIINKFDAILYQAPNAAYKFGAPTMELRNGVSVKYYRNIMENILSIDDCKKNYYGTFVGFDNSPRYGNKNSLLIEKKEGEFEYYYRRVLKKNIKNDKSFMFVNAWNEWGEGNYLEPDVKNKYSDLEVILRAKRGMECDLSIIIPAFNVAKYISECLESVLTQCQSNLKYEIIIINDGSTDNTFEILKKYQDKYPEIITMVNTNHKGVSEARNIGLDMALGKYIFYIDADDYISKDAFCVFQRTIQKYNSFDVCFFSFKNVCNEQNLIQLYDYMISKKKRMNQIEIVTNGKEAFSKMWDEQEYYPLVWLQLTRRGFLEEHGIRFCSDIIFEDQLYSFYVLYNAQKVICLNEEIYNKRIRSNSICTSEKGYEYLFSYLRIYFELNRFLIGKKKTVQNQELIDSFLDRIKKYYRNLSEDKKRLYEEKMDLNLKEVLRGLED